MKKIILMALLMFSFSANATGGYICKISDKNIDLEISATTASMPGSPLIQPTTIIVNVKAPQKGAVQFRKLEMSETNVIQYWNVKDTLNMQIVKENEEGDFYALASLIIETKSVKGKEYLSTGTYALELTANSPDGQSNNQTLTGKINCELN